MTMTLTPLPTSARDWGKPLSARRSVAALGARELHRAIVAMVRTRVPATDVEDVAQTILCDALAAAHIPSDPIELRRWLAGITRHKVADYHRRTKRTPAMTSDELALPATAPAPFEEREILQSVLEGTSSPRDRETIEWLVREHGGERFCEIAEESGVPAPVVRQRVSRLRRALRSRFMMMLLAVLAIGGGALALGSRSDVASIAPDPSAVPQRAHERVEQPTQPAAPTTPVSLIGDYRVESLSADPPVPPQMKSTVDAEMKTATVHITQGKVQIVSQSFSLSRQITHVEHDKKTGTTHFKLVGADGSVQDGTAVPEGEKHLRVTLSRPSGPMARSVGGTLLLARK